MSIPADFDSTFDMLRHETEYGVFHETRRSCRFACELIENGSSADLKLATTVLDAVLNCQSVDSADPHQGNFFWMAEDDYIQDLNAVVFCLESLIPMMLKRGKRLPSRQKDRIIGAIQLGLQEVQRLDVWAGYTNITSLALLATCLGGDLLDDSSLRSHGLEKFRTWVAFTSKNGHVLEFNSPTYAAVTMRSLATIRDDVKCPETASLSEIMLCRLGLSYVLHLHKATGRLAGPHAGAYQPSISGAAAPEIEQFKSWVALGILPSWLERLHDRLPPNYLVREGILSAFNCDMTTYVSPSFTLGSTSRSLHPQGNHVIAHQISEAERGVGVFYTRYILDDKWIGDFYHHTDRSNTRNLLDEGDFLGVQVQNVLLGCYAPQAGKDMFRSAKTSFIWTKQALVRDVLVEGIPISIYPLEAPHDARITVVTDSVYYVLQPLHVSSLLGAPFLVVDQREGDMVCEIYHYKAEKPKQFWDLRWPGAFYKGRPACLFYLEMVDRNDIPSPEALQAHLVQVKTYCQIEFPRTRTEQAEQRLLKATVEGPAGTLAMNIDLMDFAFMAPESSLQGKQEFKLESPVAMQSQESFALNGTEVTVYRGNVTFCQIPESKEWHLFQTDPEGCRIEVAIGTEVHAFQTSGMALVHGSESEIAVHNVGVATT